MTTTEQTPDTADLPIRVSLSDVPRSLAERAHAGTSFSPEKRADGIQREYVAHMQWVYESLRPLADTEEKRTLLAEELERYKGGYLGRLRAVLEARSRTLSPMITGPANFPVRSNRKKIDTEIRRVEEMTEWGERARRAIRKKLAPASGRISSDEENAVALLEEKIQKLEETQEKMKAANRIVRRKGLTEAEKLKELQALGLTEKNARAALEPDYAGRIGFPSYALTNNNANIRRLRERLEQLRKARAQETREWEFDGFRVVDDVEDNRLRIYFEDKPGADLRGRLKARAFKWAPSVGAWQRQRGASALYAAAEVLGVKIGGVGPAPAA